MRSLVINHAGCEESNYIIAYNGIDRSIQETAKQPFLPFVEREPFILGVSTINKHKNFETLIHALSILRKKTGFEHFNLKIMGRLLINSYYEFLKGEAVRLGQKDAVIFELNCPWENIAHAYKVASLFSLTSLCESFGMPALEAMAHGTPVVVGNSTAVPEICGNAAVLVSPNDHEALAEAWAKILSNESDYLKMQNAGRSRCLEFDWHKTVAQWIDVFENILSK
jgi:glycosyltransferase involved in cell wall biosynthesis